MHTVISRAAIKNITHSQKTNRKIRILENNQIIQKAAGKDGEGNKKEDEGLL
jgi:hypothetical protein